MILCPWHPGFWEILHGAMPPGEARKVIVRDPRTGLNIWRKDEDELHETIDSDEYEEWEEKQQQLAGVEPYYTRPIWV